MLTSKIRHHLSFSSSPESLLQLPLTPVARVASAVSRIWSTVTRSGAGSRPSRRTWPINWKELLIKANCCLNWKNYCINLTELFKVLLILSSVLLIEFLIDLSKRGFQLKSLPTQRTLTFHTFFFDKLKQNTTNKKLKV